MNKKISYIVIAVLVVIVILVVFNKDKKHSNVTQNSPTPNHTGQSMTHNMVVTDDKSFLQEMIPHHQEAVTSSQTILDKSSNQSLKKFAQDVISAQTQEIESMKRWYKDWYGVEYSVNSDYQAMMNDFNSVPKEDLDQQYIDGMIAHHNSAITMAQTILSITQKDDIKSLANNIIKAQTTEVEYLKSLQISKESI